MTTSTSREFPLVPERPGHRPPQINGAHAVWDDGRQTYTLQWGAGAAGIAHGWQMADWADTAIMSVEAIRADRDRLRDPAFVARALRDGRRLRQALEAIEDELIKAARADGEDGEHLLSLRDMGDELRVHYTTVRARVERLNAGERADWFEWLTQDSPAADAPSDVQA